MKKEVLKVSRFIFNIKVKILRREIQKRSTQYYRVVKKRDINGKGTLIYETQAYQSLDLRQYYDKGLTYDQGTYQWTPIYEGTFDDAVKLCESYRRKWMFVHIDMLKKYRNNLSYPKTVF